ncbi:hydroxysqualene dehydroxylase HpnE [Catenulispora pinisilvae]|uniref:hydroxysqualene dehydroxylase HpnE n=1 Tax=Catenulispora pinisilvae TaxID=2705253 RepID=UPI002B269FD1|nr:hydroxysqualene dehydroxylase HpnE [Catenulispora pinisilvae]
MSVAVVGGGLAGIAAAVALQESGIDVELYEARPRLGGATHSFQRASSGGCPDLTVDNGQHVMLRAFTAYRGLLDRLGTGDGITIQDRFDLRILTPDARPDSKLRRTRLPGPLHLLPALATYSLLDPAERLRAASASLALGKLDPADPELDAVSLGEWLDRHGQNDRARRYLWELFVTAALNCGVDEASLGLSAMVIQKALLGRADAADIGVPAIPLGELHGRAAEKALRGVHLKTKVEQVVSGTRLVVDGFPVDAEAVIVAVPHPAAAALVPPQACPDRERWAGLASSPIVDVHVLYDRPVFDRPFAAVVDSPVQWVFDRTRAAGLGQTHGQYISSVVSAAGQWIDAPVADIREVFLPALAEVMPRTRRAEVAEFFVTRERHATFRQAPGSAALRPSAGTGVPGLFLAGAWTATGWPDTMEGAVRSGLTAAALCRRHLEDRENRENRENLENLEKASGSDSRPGTLDGWRLAGPEQQGRPIGMTHPSRLAGPAPELFRDSRPHPAAPDTGNRNQAPWQKGNDR